MPQLACQNVRSMGGVKPTRESILDGTFHASARRGEAQTNLDKPAKGESR